jgi:hypothetical protein
MQTQQIEREDRALGTNSRLTLTRDKREILRQALITDLSELGGLDDPFPGPHSPTWSGARDLENALRDVLRLLEDLGWDPADPRETYTVTIERDTFAAILRRLAETAEASLRAGFDPEFADEDLDCWATCRRLLGHLERAAGGPAAAR